MAFEPSKREWADVATRCLGKPAGWKPHNIFAWLPKRPGRRLG